MAAGGEDGGTPTRRRLSLCNPGLAIRPPLGPSVTLPIARPNGQGQLVRNSALQPVFDMMESAYDDQAG